MTGEADEEDFALLFVASLLLSLAGCDLISRIKPENGTTEVEVEASDAVDTVLLWSALDGVWLDNDGQFVQFAVIDG